jgi:hypothetical protein
LGGIGENPGKGDATRCRRLSVDSSRPLPLAAFPRVLGSPEDAALVQPAFLASIRRRGLDPYAFQQKKTRHVLQHLQPAGRRRPSPIRDFPEALRPFNDDIRLARICRRPEVRPYTAATLSPSPQLGYPTGQKVSKGP